MKDRDPIRLFLWIVLTALLVALGASYVANTSGLGITLAQISPLPTATFTSIPPTNTPSAPTDTPSPPTDTPPPPTDTPLPPTPTNTPLPPTPTSTPLPPDCAAAAASLVTLWPPNHRFVSIDVLGVTDPKGNAITLTIDSIFQDEPVDAPGSGKTGPDGWGVGSASATVRAERVEGGNGRVYRISFTADDGYGTCSKEVLVGVPEGRKGTPVDDGTLYDSTVVNP